MNAKSKSAVQSAPTPEDLLNAMLRLGHTPPPVVKKVPLHRNQQGERYCYCRNCHAPAVLTVNGSMRGNAVTQPCSKSVRRV